jgi:predicted DNA-binding ribbon-helix-helix protein
VPAKRKTETFSVEARVVVIASRPVVANSLEEAIATARKMTVADFVDVIGEHNDSSIRISSVSNVDAWKTDDY